MKKHKNIYLYYEYENYQYKKVEAIDDFDRKFEYIFTETEYKKYLQQAKDMCEKFECFCTKECGFDDSATCDVWFLWEDRTPIPNDFVYESLFDISTIHDEKLYKENWDISTGYREYTLDDVVGGADWCCYQSVESRYNTENTFGGDDISFESFYKEHAAGQEGAYAIKAVVQAYKRIINKDFFMPYELDNTEKFLWDLKIKELQIRKKEHDSKEEFLDSYKKYIALLRLYMHRRNAFRKYMHEALRSLNDAHYKLDSHFYDMIYSIIYEYYDAHDFEGYEEGLLMDEKIIDTLVNKEDLEQFHAAILRYEGKEMHDGYWFRELPDEYVIKEIIRCYKTDSIGLGSMYILPDGELLFIEEGHNVIGAYLYEKGYEKDYKIGQQSKYLRSLGWIAANTKIKYIDLKGIQPTEKQNKRIEELKAFMGSDYRILTDEQ